MKILALISLLALISCGDAPKSSDGLGKTINNQERTLSKDDRDRIEFICNALDSKEDILSVLLTNKYTFGYSEKSCGSSEAETKDVVTSIERQGGDYVFEKNDGSLFGFPDVETRSQGVMTQICKGLHDQWGNYQNLTIPVKTSSTGRMWFTTKTDEKYCKSDANGLCIYIEKGTAVDDNTSQIHTQEWIKFSMVGKQRGFFIERLLVSSAGCSNKKNIEKKARLK